MKVALVRTEAVRNYTDVMAELKDDVEFVMWTPAARFGQFSFESALDNLHWIQNNRSQVPDAGKCQTQLKQIKKDLRASELRHWRAGLWWTDGNKLVIEPGQGPPKIVMHKKLIGQVKKTMRSLNP